MAFTKLTQDMNIISALDDRPNEVGGLSAADLKAKFDEAGNHIKTFINNTLTSELENGGAGRIGAGVIEGLTAATVQEALAELLGKLETKADETHAERHAAQGADPITVSTGNLSDDCVTRPKLAAGSTHTVLTLTLSPTGWAEKQQTVTAVGLTGDSTLIVAPAPDSHEEYCDAGIHATAQGADSLTFACDNVPQTALTVNVGVLR